MATEFRNTVPLADECEAAGLNVWRLDGWETNEQGYYWLNQYGRHAYYEGIPLGHTNHHTASSRYVPFVKNSKGQTKANVFFGMRRGDTLYQSGGGVPTLAFCSAGPADYSAGANNAELIRSYLPNDRRFHGPQRKTDTPGFYGNRYVWATEIVGRGDGSPIEGFDDLIVYNAVVSEYFEWSAWRNHGHYDLTRRKIDPNIQHGPYSIARIQDEVQIELTTGGDEMYAIGPGHNLNGEDISFVQYKLLRLGFLTEQGFKDSNGKWTPVTATAVRNFQGARGHFVDGIVWGYVGADLDVAIAEANSGSAPPPDLSGFSRKGHKHPITLAGTTGGDA